MVGWLMCSNLQILNDRGVECKGCVEKEDFVRRVMETSHMDL